MAQLAPDTSGPYRQLLTAEETAQSVQAMIREKKGEIIAIQHYTVYKEIPRNAIYDQLKKLDEEVRGLRQVLQHNETVRHHW
jgi:hypothetical protein